MGSSTQIDDLARQIAEGLAEYGRVINAEVQAISKEVAKETVATLKSTGGYKDRSGKYRKSFRVKPFDSYLKYSSLVHSVKQYRLTHLLENGHLTRDGTKRTRAFPHWEPAEEKAIRDFENKLKEAIRRSGN